jgi:hypothetical protein
VGEFYTPGSEGGLRYDDLVLGLSWPLAVIEISAKDRAWPLLSEIEAEMTSRLSVEATPAVTGAAR